MEAQRALAAYTWPNWVLVRVRIGLHTGHPLRYEARLGLPVAAGQKPTLVVGEVR